jgi:hypothetical protein
VDKKGVGKHKGDEGNGEYKEDEGAKGEPHLYQFS